MRIELHRSGGFAGNIRRPPLVVDTAALAEEDQRELEALAEAALARQPGGTAGPDRLQLELTVEHEGERRSATLDEAGGGTLARRMRELAPG